MHALTVYFTCDAGFPVGWGPRTRIRTRLIMSRRLLNSSSNGSNPIRGDSSNDNNNNQQRVKTLWDLSEGNTKSISLASLCFIKKKKIFNSWTTGHGRIWALSLGLITKSRRCGSRYQTTSRKRTRALRTHYAFVGHRSDRYKKKKKLV